MSDEKSRGVLPAKLYFRIGEVAGLVGVEPHVLRYWEREFRTIRPSKSAKGQRVYSRRDVENLLRVRELLYGQGFTIAGAKKRMRDKDAPLELEAQEVLSDRPFEPGASPTTEPAPGYAAPAEVAPQPLEALQAHGAAHAIPESRIHLVVPARAHERIRAQLEELKTEVEAFLEELGT